MRHYIIIINFQETILKCNAINSYSVPDINKVSGCTSISIELRKEKKIGSEQTKNDSDFYSFLFLPGSWSEHKIERAESAFFGSTKLEILCGCSQNILPILPYLI